MTSPEKFLPREEFKQPLFDQPFEVKTRGQLKDSQKLEALKRLSTKPYLPGW